MSGWSTQVERNVELHRSAIPQALWDDLRSQGLIRPDVPTGAAPRGAADRTAPDGGFGAHGDGTRGRSSRDV